MDVVLGRLHAQLERPQTRKFAWPIVILPELFTSSRHLRIMGGHLVSLGWEVYLLDAYAELKRPSVNKQIDAVGFRDLLEVIRIAVDTIGCDIVAAGHGLGGLLALRLAEAPPVRAAVALAPLIPGSRSPFLFPRTPWWFWRAKKNWMPNHRRIVELFSEAEPFQRQALISALTPMDTSAAKEAASGVIEFAPSATPRMIIAGESDGFAPSQDAAEFAAKIDARFISLPGRGHWLIAGRALERTISHLQRFLVLALGEELLLLYEKEPHGDVAKP
jgi:pimeloyl-ACP methyl ester carboxylesterase